ncbi:class I SAM-dependent methyltransferase [Kitasatospora sp. CM 4170]|uniref:Class I SAM-dependent methyltransferase n=1 Tax=Kitasatospora aburaviensis TaxID=67265 RepID=A0ABW1F9J5_9ACTN|nr:class I SAM-dependent methyltransferase [Kitasatospora sp. CM 4170]WNM49759.1 class I SAM-dependent methyltransferase [Kitasatospora sp. CM 4170]
MGSAEHAGTSPDRALGRVFGEAARLYDAGRPAYADALVSEVLAYADLGEGAALEVGAGTGKATALFAARGVPLTCVEPDPRMAEVLRCNTARFPRVQVEVGGFEEWEPDGRRFGLLFAATSWHWVDPRRRWDAVHAALRPGGAVALFWNPHGVVDAGLYAELADIDRRHGVATSPHNVPASSYGVEAGSGEEDFWPEAECRGDGRFTDLRAFRFRQDVHYGTDRYLAFLASVSSYRVLPAERREQALAETARLLDARGGGIDMLHLSDLFLARRA